MPHSHELLQLSTATENFKGLPGRARLPAGLARRAGVAGSLNEAADSGFRAFHDLQTNGNGNIDHVAV
jgi:hypothetical protein